MTRHAVSILLRLFAGLVAGLAVIAGFGVWLLSRGPISLDAVAPFVASMLSRGTDVTVTVDHTLLSLEGGRMRVLARGVHLTRDGGANALTLGDLALELSPRAALVGVLAPMRITINKPELRLDRSPDGSFHLGVGDLASDAAEDWGQKLIGDLVRPPDGRGALGHLTAVSIEHASLTVEDRALGVEWHAAEADASLTRARDRTGGSFRIVAGDGAGASRVDGDFTFLPAFGQFVVRLGFGDLKPADWAGAAPSLAGLAAIGVPVSGEFRAEFDPRRLTLRDAIVDLSLGKGELRDADFAGGVLAIAGAKLEAGYDAMAGRINLGRLSLDLDPGTVTAAGTLDGVGPDLLSGGAPQALDAKLTLAAQGLKLADFPRLWPERAAVSPRNWVTQHIREGTVDALDAQVDAHVDLRPETSEPVAIRQFDGTMSFTGLTVEYFRPLPPVRNVAGTARFDRTQIEFKATGGNVGDIHATAATARFDRLDTHDEQAKITVAAQGSLVDALALLDTPPLYYARDIGLDPKRAGGRFSAQLSFAFPLLNDLQAKDVAYGADAKLTDVALGAVMLGRDLSNGALQLKLDPAAVQVDGTAQLAGVPLNLSWKQSLDAKAPVRTHYRVKATLDDAQRQALGLDIAADMLSGPVAVDASYDLGANKRARALATLDLGAASLDVKKLSLQKAAGVPATAQLALDLLDDKVTGIRDATFEGGGISAKAAARFDDKGGVSSVNIDHVVGGANDFSGRANRDPRGGWSLVASGKSFDASGLLDALDAAPPSEGAEPPLAIDAHLDRIVLGPDRAATALALSLASDGHHWQQASVDAKLSDKTSLRLRFSGDADRPFSLTSDDFGGLLKLLGIYGDIVGGRFDLSGHAEDRNGQRVLVTKADGADYRVVRAPALARLLSLASLSGINALLTGQGIPFSRLQGNVEFSTGKIALDNARAYGGAIGINASGVIDRAAKQIDITGTLVPAYTLNSVIGNIPLLGNLLVGGAGQGIFASNFRLYGSLDEPQISVNALSTLAPGVLRNLFLFSPGGP